MADSPSKRRKLSPTASIPINTSNTPSRIPIPTPNARHAPSRRPSFASPTKASLSRHNPQLLRPPHLATTPIRPGSRGRNLEDVFAWALAEARGVPEKQTSAGRDVSESVSESAVTTQTTQENDPPTEVIMAQSQEQTLRATQRATAPKARGNVGSGISGKARRMSRSPAKRVERTPFGGSSQPAAIDFKEDINPFVKKGLRRSPPTGSQQSQVEPPTVDPVENPFMKTGLRRSPISSQATASQTTELAEESTAKDAARPAIQKTGLRRSPILSQPMETLETVVQQQAQITVQEGVDERSPIALEVVESVEENNIRQLSGFGVQPSRLRSLSAVLPENSIELSERLTVADTQQQTREDTTPLADSPLPSRLAESREQDPVDAESIAIGVPAATQLPSPQFPLLFGEQAHDANSLQESPLLPRRAQQTPDTEVQVEEQAGAQLDAELQHSAILSDPAANQPTPDVVSHTPTWDPPERPHYAPAELLRATSNLGQEVESRSPTAVKPPARSKVDEFMNPFITRRHHEEPELPPTTVQRGIPDPVVTTPPSGIHDTPSKRVRRRKGFDDKHKSSPLKPRDARPETSSSDTSSQARTKSQPQNLLAKEQSRRRRSSRFIVPVDVYAEKKAKRDDLLRQLQQLQADVALANQENDRIRTLCAAKKKSLGSAPNADDILAMLLRSTAPEPSPKPEPATVSILKSMDAFLPFRPRRKPAASPVSEKSLPSHLPIPLDDPLPYLQAFSPLTYTSTMTLLPISPPASETSSDETYQTMQKYVINASHPSGAFVARLAMVADSESFAIKTIDVLKLEMSAEAELGTFIRERAAADGPLGKDITVICWAMARWTEVCMKRARFWCAVQDEFGDAEAQAAALQKTKKRKRNADGDEDDEDKKSWTRRQLLPNMGRTSMVLVGKNIELRFEWKLSFDFTGEVDSNLTADARIPAGWQDIDDRNSLAKVPGTFGRLVKDKGPLGAVRTLAGLMLS